MGTDVGELLGAFKLPSEICWKLLQSGIDDMKCCCKFRPEI